MIEEAVAEHFRTVWRSDAGQKALRRAIEKIAREREQNRPNRLAELETRLAALDRQIAKGKENLLLVDAADVPELTQVLSGWRDERSDVQSQLEAERANEREAPDLDADRVLAELEELEEHLSVDCAPLAKAAFSRLFKSVTLFWKQVGPRRRELERAEVETHFPFV